MPKEEDAPAGPGCGQDPTRWVRWTTKTGVVTVVMGSNYLPLELKELRTA